MIIVSRNIKGFGRQEKRLAVRKLVRRQRVDFLLLQETKVASNVDQVIQEVWGAQSCGWDWVSSQGASGGLIAIWDDKVLCEEEVFKDQRIMAIKGRSLGDDFVRAVDNVYGPNEERDRGPF